MKEAHAEEQPFQKLGRKMEKSNIFKEKKLLCVFAKALHMTHCKQSKLDLSIFYINIELNGK